MLGELEMSAKCVCKADATQSCDRCKLAICDECDCGMLTVDGYLCGSYTQWGCAKKYTTCDCCLDDAAIHEADLNFCEECGNALCDACVDLCCEPSNKYEIPEQDNVTAGPTTTTESQAPEVRHDKD